MKKKDAIGLGISLAVHAVALMLFVLVTTAARRDHPPLEEPPFIEIEFGLEKMGAPSRSAEPVAQPAPRVKQPPVKKVELPKPKPVKAPEKVRTPKTERIAPEEPTAPAPPQETSPETPAQPARQGTPGATDRDASAGTGAGTAGTASGAYDMEGLANRVLLRNPLPRNVDNTRANFQFRITVAPDGTVRDVITVRKGNSPGNEAAAKAALRQWRFNTLPANAPNQQGTITFRFTLE